jgi:cbb3-type cytochrome oxidase subunit 3
MTPGVALIVYLVALYIVSMLVMWYCFRGQKRERIPRIEIPLALRKGQAILG